MRAVASALLVASSVLAQAPGQAMPAIPPKPIQLPADWASRDLEARWVAYRASMEERTQPPLQASAWAKALGQARDVELLEWIVLFEGWRDAGPELARLDAPQLLRAAAWNLGSFDSHGQSSAKKVLLQRSERVLGWLEAHADAVHGGLAALRQELVAAGVTARREATDLPPHDPMQVLVPWLDAPATLQTFPVAAAEPAVGEAVGEAKRGAKVKYVHQVVRALGGVLTLGETDERVLTKVVGLTRHGNETVRLRAFDTLGRLPPRLVPLRVLANIVDDPDATAERRRLALLALSASSHPDMLDVLVRVAGDAEHPAWLEACKRFGEVGDPVAATPLREAATASPRLLQALLPTFTELERRQSTSGRVPALPSLLLRAAWQRHRREARADATWAATKQLVLTSAGPKQIEEALAGVLAIPVDQSPLRGDEAVAVARVVNNLVNELREDLAKTSPK